MNFIVVETAGHIPGALNLPIGKMIDSDKGVLQNMEKLKQCKFNEPV